MNKSRPLGTKQKVIIGYLWNFLSSMGRSPTHEEAASGSGYEDLSWVLRVLEIRGIVEIGREKNWSGRGRMGKGLAVYAVHCPERGSAFVRDTDGKSQWGVDKRPCICCRGLFESKHKFNRLCDLCTVQADHMVYGENELGYVSNNQAILSGEVGGRFFRPSREINKIVYGRRTA